MSTSTPRERLDRLLDNPPPGLSPAAVVWINDVVAASLEMNLPLLAKSLESVLVPMVADAVEETKENVRRIAEEVTDSDPADDWKRGYSDADDAENHDEE